MPDREIGARIRSQRELLGYTREELAEKINVSPKFCSDIELGNKGMSVETLIRISKELMLTTDYILFGKPQAGVDDEITNLINLCSNENLEHLKSIMRTFIKACTK